MCCTLLYKVYYANSGIIYFVIHIFMGECLINRIITSNKLFRSTYVSLFDENDVTGYNTPGEFVFTMETNQIPDIIFGFCDGVFDLHTSPVSSNVYERCLCWLFDSNNMDPSNFPIYSYYVSTKTALFNCYARNASIINLGNHQFRFLSNTKMYNTKKFTIYYLI